MVTATVMLGTMMNAIDTSIVNVALPYMRGGLGASIEEIARVSTGFILANVIIMPIIALLSARFGRRRSTSSRYCCSRSPRCSAAWPAASIC